MDDTKFKICVEEVRSWFLKAPTSMQDEFKNAEKEELILWHSTLGRSIRNKFNLWQDSWKPIVNNGVDISPHHPDAISMRIIEAVWEKVNGK